MDQSHAPAQSSTTAYHSFNDIELYEPASPPRRKQSPSSRHSYKSSSSSSSHQKSQNGQPTNSGRSSQDDRPPTAPRMKRQDSGYESHASTPTPRGSISHPQPARPAPPRRTSTSNVQGHMSSSSVSKPRGRPSTRRSMKAHSLHQGQQSNAQMQQPASLYLVQSSPVRAQPTVASPTTLDMSSYVQFPSPDPSDVQQTGITGQQWYSSTASGNASSGSSSGSGNSPYQAEDQHPPPPQTTHYWTSDRTRRLEYAAIDAASRGLKGWIRKNLLPDCFIPRDDAHIPFDDDTGSVRRYRLELEDDVSASPVTHSCSTHRKTLSATSVVPRRMRTWQLWGGSRSSDDGHSMGS